MQASAGCGCSVQAVILVEGTARVYVAVLTPTFDRQLTSVHCSTSANISNFMFSNVGVAGKTSVALTTQILMLASVTIPLSVSARLPPQFDASTVLSGSTHASLVPVFDDQTTSGSVSTASSITTAIQLASSPVASCSTTAALTTAIRMAASASGVVSIAAQLTVSLAAVVFVKVSSAASLTTAIQSTASSIAAVSVTSALTTAITFSASSAGSCSTTYARLGTTFDQTRATCSCIVVADLLASAKFAATPSVACSTAATINAPTIFMSLPGMACSTSSVLLVEGTCRISASLLTAIAMAASSTVPCSIVAILTLPLSVQSQGICTTSANLTTSILCAAQASGAVSTFTIAGNLAATVTAKASIAAALHIGSIWTDVGFNFRGTANYVLDGQNQTKVLADFYPHPYSVNGVKVIAGWTGTGPTILADRNNALDSRLAGSHSKTNDNTSVQFNVVLPQAGTWFVSFALGDIAAQGYQFGQLYDNGTLVATYDEVGGNGANNWFAADGLSYDQTTWPAVGSTKIFTHSFQDVGDGTGLFSLLIGSPTLQTGFTTIAHLRLQLSPGQGALLKASVLAACSTSALITVPASATAICRCSTDVTFDIEMVAVATGACAVSANLTTSISTASIASGSCSVAAALTAPSRQFAGRPGISIQIPSQATNAIMEWTANIEPDLAGYRIYRGTAPGVYNPSDTIDVGLLPPNTLLWTEDLTNGVWTLEGASIHPFAHGEDGQLTAFELVQTVASGYHRIFQTATGVLAGIYTASVLGKSGGNTLVQVRLFGDASHSYAAEFDLVQGLITPGSSAPYPGTTASIVSLGGGWYQCIVSGVLVAGSAALYAELNDVNHLGQYAGDGTSGAILHHPMIQLGTFPGLYAGSLANPAVSKLESGLLSNTTYYFAVTAYDTTNNESAPSSEVSKFIPWGLKTAIQFSASTSGIASTLATGRFSGAAFFSTTPSIVLTVAAALSTAISENSSAVCACQVSASLQNADAAQFAAAATLAASATGSVTTAITAKASPVASAQIIAILNLSSIQLASVVGMGGSVSASLVTAIRGTSVSGVGMSVQAFLSTSIPFVSVPNIAVSTTANLVLSNHIASSAVGALSTAGVLTTTIALRGQPISSMSTSATLSTIAPASFAVVATGKLASAAGLASGIAMQTVASGSASTSATLGSYTPPFFDNVQERFAERGIERGIFSAGG